MQRNKDKLSMIIYGGSILSTLIAFISLFFTYNIAQIGTYKRTGFHIFTSENTMAKIWAIFFIILALAIIALGIAKLLGMFDEKIYTYIFVAMGALLLLTSIILFCIIVNVKWANTLYDYKRGAGIIINLIFSILNAIFCVGALLKLRQ